MSRIAIPTLDSAPAASKPLLDSVLKKLGVKERRLGFASPGFGFPSSGFGFPSL
jgi:hypothetical protein